MNILIADDESLIREGIEKRIYKYGYHPEHIYQAVNGNHAMEFLEKYPIDMVFVDINMPFTNGLELMEKYKDKGIAFVIVSGYSDFAYAQKAIELGAYRYLLKPIKKDEFIKVMDELSERFSKSEDKMQYSALTRQILSSIRQNLNDPGYSLGACAMELNVSESSISKMLKRELNTGFSDLLSHSRIEKSIKMMNQKEGLIKMSDIARECGFTSSQYFSVIFRKQMGITPTEYKEKIQRNETV